MSHPVAAVVLAAGAGTRFAGPTHKLRAELRGTPVVRHCIDAAVASGIGPVLVVTGAEDLDDVLPPMVSQVRASDWASGQSQSLAAAATALADTHVGAMVVGLGDMPGVTADCWRAVADCPGEIVVATYDGHRRPPVKLDRAVWDLLPERGDEGARDLMARRPDLVREVAVGGDGRDVDTVDDLRSRGSEAPG